MPRGSGVGSKLKIWQNTSMDATMISRLHADYGETDRRSESELQHRLKTKSQIRPEPAVTPEEMRKPRHLLRRPRQRLRYGGVAVHGSIGSTVIQVR